MRTCNWLDEFAILSVNDLSDMATNRNRRELIYIRIFMSYRKLDTYFYWYGKFHLF